MSRVYLPTFAELVDRLSIVILKSVFIPENKAAYIAEQELIVHDIDELLCEKMQDSPNIGCPITGEMIRAILILMLTNRYIWENESRARAGGVEQDKLLKLTHSINGVRSTAKNVVSHGMGERVDLKIDALAADLVQEFGNWQLFENKEQNYV